MLTPRQAFKFGFLMRCAEEGLTQQETTARIKLAGIMSSLGNLAVAAPAVTLAASGVGGAALGYGAAKLTEPDADPEEAKLQELMAAYRMYADHARRNTKQRGYRPSSNIRPPRLLGAA